MISLYTTAFNIEHTFDISATVKNYLTVADEVVIATISEPLMKDNTHHILNDLAGKYANVKIVTTNINPYNDVRWDGQLKNESLQNCSHKNCIQCDLDERVCGKKELWQKLFDMIEKTNVSSIMLPVINLYHSSLHFKDIGFKWYLHKKDGCFRGPVNFAIRKDGTVDTSKSDGTELIDGNGNLVKFITLQTQLYNEAAQLSYMRQGNNPFIVHYGHIDSKRRAKLNKAFWKDAWSRLNGSEATDVKINANDLQQEEYKLHLITNLPSA